MSGTVVVPPVATEISGIAEANAADDSVVPAGEGVAGPEIPADEGAASGDGPVFVRGDGLPPTGGGGRRSLQDVWLPHLFSESFVPYAPGKHVEIPIGAPGAVLSSNEHPYGPAPAAMRDLLADGVKTLFGRMRMEDKLPEAMSILGADGAIFRTLSESTRQYMDDYGPFADAYAAYLGFGITGAQVYVASGCSQLIYKLIRATNPVMGGVMAFMPGFFMYPIGASAEDRPFHSVFLNDDLSYPFDRFMKEAEEVDPGLIFIDTPNNPTGGTVPKGWLMRLIEARLRHNGYVAVDEAYFDFRRGEDLTVLGLLGNYPNLIVLRSFSKFLGLAGGRLGFGIAAPDSVAQTLFGRIKTPFEVATTTVNLATYSLKPEAQGQLRCNALEVMRERERLNQGLSVIHGITAFPSEANFILIDVKGTGKTAAQVDAELRRRDLYARPLPKNPRFVPPHISGRYELLRISVGSPDQNDQLLNALREIGARS